MKALHSANKHDGQKKGTRSTSIEVAIIYFEHIPHNIQISQVLL